MNSTSFSDSLRFSLPLTSLLLPRHQAMLETLKNLEEEAGGFKKVVKTKKGRTPSAKGFAKAKRPSFFGGRSPVIGGAGVSM